MDHKTPRSILTYCKTTVGNFLLTQMCITLFSWPILLEWGLPVPILSPIGNAIFSPFINIFLAISGLIVGAEMAHIPHGILDWTLEYITSFWLALTKLAPEGLILTLRKPPLLFSLCAPLGTIIIMHTRTIRGMWRKIGSLCALFTVLTLIFMLFPMPSKILIPYESHTITVYKNTHDDLVAIDTGFSRRTGGIESWINFTLLPQLAIKYGRQRIKRYICKKITPTIVTFFKTICEKKIIDILELPAPQHRERYADKKMRDELIAIAHKNSVTIY